MTPHKQQGQSPIQIIGLIAFIGLATSLLAFLRFDAPAAIDPVLIFLLVAYPFLIGTAIYFYLQDKKIATSLQEEYYIKWFLQSFAKVCLSENDQQVIREELSSTILRLIRPALVMVYEISPETERLEVTQQSGIKNLPDTAAHGYAFGEGIPGWVMQNQNTVILADISKEQYLQVEMWARSLELRSYAAVPIIAKAKSVGIIGMYSLEPGFFHDSNLLIAQLAAQLYGLRLASQSGQ
ncbi:MAG: GAF domain-containing protein [Deltaproteobacteria bacterium]|nr:GAF domain-containing protein [Deltaproteobacteria bacterium]